MAEAVSLTGISGGPGDPQNEHSYPYEEYECKICYNYFDLGRRTPKILECLHTFCEECLNTLHLREDRGWRIGCPLCRHRTPVPEYRIRNLPNNTKVTDAFPLYIEAVDPLLPQDSLPAHPPPLHPDALDHQAGVPSVAVVGGSSNSRDSAAAGGYESCQSCRRVALTTGYVCTVFTFLSMLVLLFLGLIFVNNVTVGPPPPSLPALVGPVCLSVASILAMLSIIITWLTCWLKYRTERPPRRERGFSSSGSRRNNAL